MTYICIYILVILHLIVRKINHILGIKLFERFERFSFIFWVI